MAAWPCKGKEAARACLGCLAGRTAATPVCGTV